MSDAGHDWSNGKYHSLGKGLDDMTAASTTRQAQEHEVIPFYAGSMSSIFMSDKDQMAHSIAATSAADDAFVPELNLDPPTWFPFCASQDNPSKFGSSIESIGTHLNLNHPKDLTGYKTLKSPQPKSLTLGQSSSRKRGRLDPVQRSKVKTVRRKRACLRCRIYKESVRIPEF